MMTLDKRSYTLYCSELILKADVSIGIILISRRESTKRVAECFMSEMRSTTEKKSSLTSAFFIIDENSIDSFLVRVRLINKEDFCHVLPLSKTDIELQKSQTVSFFSYPWTLFGSHTIAADTSLTRS